MSVRVQVILDEDEQERIRQEAERQGLSVSAWMREAARERLKRRSVQARLDSFERLERFFAECDERETGDEPDWEQHRAVIDASRASGGSQT